jgi:hypothetical protein
LFHWNYVIRYVILYSIYIYHTQKKSEKKEKKKNPHTQQKNQVYQVLGDQQNSSLVEPNMVLSLWKNQSSDIKLVDFCTSGVRNLVELLKSLGFGALKLELGISQIFEYSRR